MVPRMAAWSHRIDTSIWVVLCFSFIGWLTALVGVITSQRELHGQDDDNGRTFEVRGPAPVVHACFSPSPCGPRRPYETPGLDHLVRDKLSDIFTRVSVITGGERRCRNGHVCTVPRPRVRFIGSSQGDS